MKSSLALRSACFLCLATAPALAKVSPQEASQLDGPKLTAFGAERAGNADGSIPAYTGPLTSPPPGIVVTNPGMPPDPFPNDKVLYTVSASNLSQYSSLVAPGIQAVMRKYPTFHLDVYQTRRTAGYPQWILDNTRKNAVNAELTGSVEGDGVKGAYGGIPFPIPKNGYEVLWNLFLVWAGVSVTQDNLAGYSVDSSGNRSLDGRTSEISNYPYYDPTKSSDPDGIYYHILTDQTAPAAEDGQKNLITIPLNYSENDEMIYVYTVGQRRVRLAPEEKYDTPVPSNGGAYNFDEINMFTGRPDKFNFKLVGKKELLIPYNTGKAEQWSVSPDQLMLPHHPNPDLIRWEKHRVWVVDGTLKPGYRHVYSRRTFYIDEDTWNLSIAESYDQASVLYRVAFEMVWPDYAAPYPLTNNPFEVFFNLNRGSYAIGNWAGGLNHGSIIYSNKLKNPAMFSPEAMAGQGLR